MNPSETTECRSSGPPHAGLSGSAPTGWMDDVHLPQNARLGPSHLPTPPPLYPPAALGSRPANLATLWDLVQRGVITQAQFDLLTAASGAPPDQFAPVATAAQPLPPPSAQQQYQHPTGPPASSTQLPAHLASPVPPPIPQPSTSSFYSPNPASSPFHLPPNPRAPPPQHSATVAAFQSPRPHSAIPQHALQRHLAAMDSIQQLQHRIRALASSVSTGISLAGPAREGGQPMSAEQKEQAEKEQIVLKTRQTTLVTQCQGFVQAHGGQPRVAEAIRALQMSQRHPPAPLNGSPAPSYGAPWGSSPSPFPFPYPTPPSYPSSHPHLSPALQHFPAYTSTPPPLFFAHPSPAPSPAVLPPGLQASLAARANRPPPAVVKPILSGVSRPGGSILSLFRTATPPASNHGSPPASLLGRQFAGIPRGRGGSTAGKHPTQIIADWSPGMPTLAQLQAQLKPGPFATSLRAALGKRGIEINEPYIIDGLRVPLYELYQAVMVIGGGGLKVDTDRQWRTIARELGLPDTIKFSDALGQLYNDVLRPYEDMWSEAILRHREKLASRGRSRGSNSSDSSGPSSTRDIPTSLKFSEPSRSTLNGPPPPPVPPPYAQSAPSTSLYSPSPSTAAYTINISQPSPWSNAYSSSGPPQPPREQTVPEPQQQFLPMPFSQPPPAGSITAPPSSAPTPSDSGRFAQLEPATKKGRTSAGSTRSRSSLGPSPAGSTHSRDSTTDHDSPRCRKRAHAPDAAVLPTPPSAEPHANFGGPDPELNHVVFTPSFEFTSADWTGAGAWPTTSGLDGEFDFGQYIASASPALSADTPDLVAAQGNDQSPDSDDQEPEPNAGRAIAVDTMGSGWSAPAIASPDSFGLQAGLSDQLDPPDTDKWPMLQPFDFDEAFGWGAGT